MTTIKEIIMREKFIIFSLNQDLKRASCKSCVKESIEYHEAIIKYMDQLLEFMGVPRDEEE